jgi:hypothetical protein
MYGGSSPNLGLFDSLGVALGKGDCGDAAWPGCRARGWLLSLEYFWKYDAVNPG